MSIVNYSQAIKYDPNDYESYFQRAEMYEKVDEFDSVWLNSTMR